MILRSFDQELFSFGSVILHTTVLIYTFPAVGDHTAQDSDLFSPGKDCEGSKSRGKTSGAHRGLLDISS
jgi:hypothetical protein